MINIGCHLSSSKGFCAMANNAISINADTFQFFTRNPQGSKAEGIKNSKYKEYFILSASFKFDT